jgi:mannosyltransferase OCH1-like enzyme
MIPKVIHYCWLSGDPLPEKFEYCVKTWHEKLDGYEFVLWNFDRFDINRSIWVKQAFLAKKYAFAADYIRLFAIYNYGGIYLDMDVEVVKPFGDLLNRNIMLGYEDDDDGTIAADCFGAEKWHPFIKKCLDYHEREFNAPMVLPVIMRNILKESFSGEDYHILPSEYFSPKNFFTGKIEKTKNTYTIHHYTGSWLPESVQKDTQKRWGYFSVFGNNAFSRMLFTFAGSFRSHILSFPRISGYFIKRIKKDGFFIALKYYLNKYLHC